MFDVIFRCRRHLVQHAPPSSLTAAAPVSVATAATANKTIATVASSSKVSFYMNTVNVDGTTPRPAPQPHTAMNQLAPSAQKPAAGSGGREALLPRAAAKSAAKHAGSAGYLATAACSCAAVAHRASSMGMPRLLSRWQNGPNSPGGSMPSLFIIASR